MLQWSIRTAGCSVKECAIRHVCDEPKALVTHGSEDVEPRALALEAHEAVGGHAGGGWVHVTGGEPMDQETELYELVDECHRLGMQVHLQTSGTRIVRCPWEWITVSPKHYPHSLRQRFGQEMVLVNWTNRTLDNGILLAFAEQTKFWNYYLVPEWDPKHGPNTEDTIEKVKRANNQGALWQLAIQAHKYWGVK